VIGNNMTDKEELKALLKSYKESPSRGIKDEIAISKIEDIIDNNDIVFSRIEELPEDFIFENPDIRASH
jgi:hypothetical protein